MNNQESKYILKQVKAVSIANPEYHETMKILRVAFQLNNPAIPIDINLTQRTVTVPDLDIETEIYALRVDYDLGQIFVPLFFEDYTDLTGVEISDSRLTHYLPTRLIKQLIAGGSNADLSDYFLPPGRYVGYFPFDATGLNDLEAHVQILEKK